MPEQDLSLSFDGKLVSARAGESVASALVRAGSWVLGRSVKYHRPRGAFCHQGACGSCLVRVDGLPNQRACRTTVTDGMSVEAQNVYPSVALDVVGVTDFFFPRGMDHHTLMTGAPKAVHGMMQKIARQLAGLGTLPDERPLDIPPSQHRDADVLVIGGGPAGFAAAIAAARGGRRVTLVDENERMGGSLLADPRHGSLDAQVRIDDAIDAGVELLPRTTVLGWYGEDRLPGDTRAGLFAAATADGILTLTAKDTVYATGSYDQNALFPDNDRPGVLSARAVGRLLVRDGIIAGTRVLVLGAGPYARALGEALEGAGSTVLRLDGTTETIDRVLGTGNVTGVVAKRGKKREKLKCGVIAVAALPAPATELPREHGAAVEWDPARGGFHVVADERGRTRIDHVHAAGDVTGFVGPQGAYDAGAKVGAALAVKR